MPLSLQSIVHARYGSLETAGSGIRVNGVAPGPTDTGMLTRFTGTPENKAALVTGVPMAASRVLNVSRRVTGWMKRYSFPRGVAIAAQGYDVNKSSTIRRPAL
jgi:NAD(P)-dependent dehydrogenase (short-subunit alcohol dehydrogenase family)